MAAGRLIPVRVGGVLIEAEAVPVAGTEPTSGRLSRTAGEVADAFDRAQDAIVGVARSTATMIERAGAAARPDRVEVEFGLKFSASGGVIMAGVAGEASLKVTLSYDVAARPSAGPSAGAMAGTDGAEAGDDSEDALGVGEEAMAVSDASSAGAVTS